MAGISEVTIYVDGAAKGNPGPAGIGVRLESEGRALSEHAGYIGTATNNAAEYHALIKGLKMARELSAPCVQVVSDSELMVRQMNGSYRVKNPGLLALYREARNLSGSFERFRIRHVLRGQNAAADRLANKGIQKGRPASRSDGRAHTG